VARDIIGDRRLKVIPYIEIRVAAQQSFIIDSIAGVVVN
jgi:hypothetical protein